jgi:hypothetical protein
LLQLAYNLDYSEQFIASENRPDLGTTDLAAPHIRSWETKSIFKDDALRHDYFTGEVVSVVSSLRGGVIQPPFTIVPFEDISDGCIYDIDSEELETRTIERLPFDVAIPVLTGWDLSFVCHDQNVEEIGVYIRDFHYTPRGRRGILEYNLWSMLHDQDENDGTRFRHKVSFIGFDRAPNAPLTKDTDTLRDRATTSNGLKPTIGGRPIR